MENRVRYICISTISLELVDALPDHEKVIFIEQLSKMYQSCKSGIEPEPDQTENRVLDIALEHAAREMKNGYDTYVKRMTARLKASQTDQRSINDRSMIALEEKRKEKERDIEKEREEEEEEIQEGEPFLDQQAVSAALNAAWIQPDEAFWLFAKKAGTRITLEAIRKAREMDSRSLPYVVKLMKDEIENTAALNSYVKRFEVDSS